MSYGSLVAIIGVALCIGLCGIGSSMGLFRTGSAVAGVLGENPKKFGGPLIVLALLPATQGIYGFLIALLASNKIEAAMTLQEGWALFGAVLPMAITGFVSGILQGRAATNCILAVGRQENVGGKLILFPAMVEFYAILGLIVSIMVIARV